MTVTRHSNFHSPGDDLTREQWIDAFVRHGSLDTPLFNNVPDKMAALGWMYDYIQEQGHHAGVWLGIGIVEHSLGTNTNSVLHRNDTRSLTNARRIRHPNVTGAVVSDVERGGPYVAYRNVMDSLRDGLYRIDEPGYAYQQAGAETLEEVFNVWTEGDGGAYADTVARIINESTSQFDGDDPRFDWVPDTSEYGYPQGTTGRNGRTVDLLIIHTTEGTNSLPWLNGNNGSSAHYLTWPDGRPRAQMVRESDAAWTAGNREYNERGVNVEIEGFSSDPGMFTDDLYRNVARICADIIRRNPAILPDRAHVIGHAEVPDPDGSGFGGAGNHTDPGPHFDWPKFMGLLRASLGLVGPPPEEDTAFPGFPDPLVVNGFRIEGGFRAQFLTFGAIKSPTNPIHGGIALFGLPLGHEYKTDFGAAQKFERYVMEWVQGEFPPWDLIGTIRGENEPPELI